MAFFHDISKDMARNMSSWNSFNHLSNACSKANKHVETNVNKLIIMTKTVVNSQKDNGKPLQI